MTKQLFNGATVSRKVRFVYMRRELVFSDILKIASEVIFTPFLWQMLAHLLTTANLTPSPTNAAANVRRIHIITFGRETTCCRTAAAHTP